MGTRFENQILWENIIERPFAGSLSLAAREFKLNPFVIEADWRPVAKAWEGRD